MWRNTAMNRHEHHTGRTEQDVRAELALLQARYDSGAIPQAVFSVIRRLETEISWIEHLRVESK
jgi:hypothetical protein